MDYRVYANQVGRAALAQELDNDTERSIYALLGHARMGTGNAKQVGHLNRTKARERNSFLCLDGEEGGSDEGDKAAQAQTRARTSILSLSEVEMKYIVDNFVATGFEGAVGTLGKRPMTFHPQLTPFSHRA